MSEMFREKQNTGIIFVTSCPMENSSIEVRYPLKISDPKIPLKLNQICRTCLKEADDMFLLSSMYNVEGKTQIVFNILEILTSLQYKGKEDLPNLICKDCLQCAKFAYCFKKQCEEAENMLIEYLAKIRKDSFVLPKEEGKDDELHFSDTEEALQCDNFISTKESSQNQNYDIDLEYNDTENDICNESAKKTDLSEDKKLLNKINFYTRTQCTMCSKKVRNIKQHMKRHTARVHTCEECGKSYSSHYDLKNHLKSHSSEKPFQCDRCPKSFRHKFRLNEHMLGHDDKKGYICELCGKGFNRAKELATHGRVHTGVRPHKCKICHKSFVGSDTLNKHMRTHSGRKEHACSHCGKTFSAADQLKVHLRTHTGEKPYICCIKGCGKSFATMHSLNMHNPVHTNDKPYSCIECGKNFAREQDRRKHQALHQTLNRPLECPKLDCLHTCSSPQLLKEHVASHEGEKRALCTQCGKCFGRKADLKRHTLTHTQERPFRCPHCAKGFNQQFGLTQHLRYHTGEACFICDLCGKGFMRKATLMKHKLVHTGVRSHKCDLCSRAFTISAHLVRHRRIHTGERPYQCDTCHKSFSARSGYVVHLRSHTGERPYHCQYCDKTCATSTALKIHTRNHTGEKPYMCPQCGRSFARSDLRSLHMKTCCPETPPGPITASQVPHGYYLHQRDMDMDTSLSGDLSCQNQGNISQHLHTSTDSRFANFFCCFINPLYNRSETFDNFWSTLITLDLLIV